MDIANHAVQGFILHTGLALLINLIIPVNVVAIGLTGLVGAVPDLDITGGKVYVSMHKGIINKIMKWIPAWGIHTEQDLILHNEGERWWIKGERLWYEFLTWYINIFLIIKLIICIKNF